MSHALLGTAFWSLLAAASTTYSETREIHWHEQVKLSTGKVIVVERGEKLNFVSEPGRHPGWLFDEAWLKVQLPGGGEAQWQGALSPLVLNATAQHVWYLLGITAAHRGHKEYGLLDNKRYVAFKLNSNQWQRIPFSEFPPEFTPNLLADTYSVFIKQEQPNDTLVDLEAKLHADSNPTLGASYKRIDRSLGQ